MSMTLFDAMKLSRNPMAVEVLDQVATSAELFGVLPFVPKSGEGFGYQREVTTGSFNFITPGGAVASSTATTEDVVITKREASEDFWIPNFAEDNMSDLISPKELQLKMKLKAAGRAIAGKVFTGTAINGFVVEAFQSGPYVDALVSASAYIRDRKAGGALKYTHSGTLLQFRAPGDDEFGTAVACASDGSYTLTSKSPSKWIRVTLDVSDATADATREISFTTSTKEFDGVARLVSSGQTRLSSGTHGDNLSYEIMEELLDAVKNKDNLVFVGPAALRRKYNTLVRALGGTQPEHVLMGGQKVPTFNGVPFLADDNIPRTEAKGSGTTLSSLYLMNLGEGEGVYMGANGGDRFNVDADPRDVSVLGFQLRDLGQSHTNSEGGTRLAWYGGLAVGSDLSLAAAKELVTA